MRGASEQSGVTNFRIVILPKRHIELPLFIHAIKAVVTSAIQIDSAGGGFLASSRMGAGMGRGGMKRPTTIVAVFTATNGGGWPTCMTSLDAERLTHFHCMIPRGMGSKVLVRGYRIRVAQYTIGAASRAQRYTVNSPACAAVASCVWGRGPPTTDLTFSYASHESMSAERNRRIGAPAWVCRVC